MSWTNFSEREKYVSLRRTISVLFIGLMAWPRRCHFKPRSAGEVKAFKCLTLRKGIISLENPHEVNWTSEKGIISLINAREVILTSKKGAILLVTHKKQLASGKECCSSPIWSEATSGDPSAKLPISARLPRRAKLHRSGYNSSANLFQLESGAKGKVGLNLKSDVHTHTPSIKAVQSISKYEPFHCRFMKTLKGVLLTL